jgi:hypothetical protein
MIKGSMVMVLPQNDKHPADFHHAVRSGFRNIDGRAFLCKLRTGLTVRRCHVPGIAQESWLIQWSDTARQPIKGDVPTYGFGGTRNPDGKLLRGGEKITPSQAVTLALLGPQEP